MSSVEQKKITVAVLLFVGLITIAIPAGAQHQHNFEPGFNLFSKQQDVQLGQESAGQVRNR